MVMPFLLPAPPLQTNALDCELQFCEKRHTHGVIAKLNPPQTNPTAAITHIKIFLFIQTSPPNLHFYCGQPVAYNASAHVAAFAGPIGTESPPCCILILVM